MELRLARRRGVPLYLQIKEQIVSEIKNQGFTPGQKMPTERELAKKLGTSRNTVSSAYRLLEDEGVLVSYQGKGTFIAGEDRAIVDSPATGKILAMIDEVLDYAMGNGLSTDDFSTMVADRIRVKEELLQKVKAVFVECNIEQARIFAKELGGVTHYTIEPVVLKDLREDQSLLTGAELIFTTFTHLDEVRRLASGLNIPIAGVAVKPCLEGIVRIARYSQGTRFGVVCRSREFYDKFRRNLDTAGLENLELSYTASEESGDVRQVLDEADVIITSPGRCSEVKEILGEAKEVIVFNTTLDIGSVRAVLSDNGDASINREV
ncbi:MAG: winged helix-turn-helix domain-containing protein [Bacillota bacterium]|nr:winged helix-turn-helix domain-containing protein [Bacillota bacterium]MDW7682710.1 winged helix-turn-helix domain-containing protein [Bacillota bacterium]